MKILLTGAACALAFGATPALAGDYAILGEAYARTAPRDATVDKDVISGRQGRPRPSARRDPASSTPKAPCPARASARSA
jgi:hypothetical protein